MLDGPVLPGAAALLFSILHKAPALAEWQSIVVMQCFFQALCAVFVYLLSFKLLERRLPATIAAGLWIVYPPAITSCNSLLTEPLACTLSVAFIFFLTGFSDSKGKLAYSKCFFAGLTAIMLSLLKPALAPATGLITLLGFLLPFISEGSYDAKKSFSFLCISRAAIYKVLFAVLGFAVLLLPWFSFTCAARGKIILLPSRRPVYNICTGLNVEGDGWGTYPTHPLALMFDDNESALPVALALIQDNPGDIANLTLRKSTRLFNLPWNDYRYKVIGLGYKLQAISHMLLVSLGFSGAILLFAGIFAGKFNSGQKLLGISMLIFVASHLIYLPFEGISRYGFTAVPCLIVAGMFLLEQMHISKFSISVLSYWASLILFILFSKLDLVPFILYLPLNSGPAIGIAALIRWLPLLGAGLSLWRIAISEPEFNQLSRRVLASAISVFLLIAAAIAAAFAVSSHESPVWQCNLKSGDMATRIVKMDGLPAQKPDWALLLVDGDQRIGNAQLFVNGHHLEAAESVYQFYTEQYELNEWLNQFASLIRKDPGSLRRWRATKVPLDALESDWNRLECSGPKEGAITIYGDYLEQSKNGRRMLPSPSEVSPGKFFNDAEEAYDSRIMQATYSTIGSSKCDFEHDLKRKENDLSPGIGVQKGNYRLYLLLGYKHPTGAVSDTANSAPAAAPASTTWNDINNGGKIQLAPGSKSRTVNLLLNEAMLSGSHIRVRLKAESKSAAASSFTVAGVVEKGESFMASVLPGSPFLVNTAAEWHTFEFASELPTVTVKGKKPELRIELNAVAAESEIRNLQIQVEPVNKPQFSNHSIKVF